MFYKKKYRELQEENLKLSELRVMYHNVLNCSSWWNANPGKNILPDTEASYKEENEMEYYFFRYVETHYKPYLDTFRYYSSRMDFVTVPKCVPQDVMNYILAKGFDCKSSELGFVFDLREIKGTRK